MGRVSYKTKIERLGCGDVSSINDLVLYYSLMGCNLIAIASLPRQRNAKGAMEMVGELESLVPLVKEEYKSIRRAYYRLKQKGLVDFARILTESPKLTKRGEERLKSLFPKYQKNRTWDGNLYVITYDIPEKHRGLRNQLRKILKKIGCGQFQESVWITPYNPKSILNEFSKSNHLLGNIIVSDFATDDGLVGEEPIPQFLVRVYGLDALNEEYRLFIENVKMKPSWQVNSEYCSLLRQDPQLPFELLPSEWEGDKAYAVLINHYPEFKNLY